MNDLLIVTKCLKHYDKNDPDYLLKRMIEIEKDEVNSKYYSQISFSSLIGTFQFEKLNMVKQLLHRTFEDVYDKYVKENGKHFLEIFLISSLYYIT